MPKDAVFRLRMRGEDLSALKRVARDKGLAASEYARRLLADQVRRDNAARRVRGALGGARRGRLDDARSMALADEAKHRSRRP